MVLSYLGIIIKNMDKFNQKVKPLGSNGLKIGSTGFKRHPYLSSKYWWQKSLMLHQRQLHIPLGSRRHVVKILDKISNQMKSTNIKLVDYSYRSSRAQTSAVTHRRIRKPYPYPHPYLRSLHAAKNECKELSPVKVQIKPAGWQKNEKEQSQELVPKVEFLENAAQFANLERKIHEFKLAHEVTLKHGIRKKQPFVMEQLVNIITKLNTISEAVMEFIDNMKMWCTDFFYNMKLFGWW